MYRKTHVRCRSCEARRTLARHPNHYQIVPACRYCGARSWRVVRWQKTRTCNCPGYWFPHHEARGRCIYNPNWSESLYDEPAPYEPL